MLTARCGSWLTNLYSMQRLLQNKRDPMSWHSWLLYVESYKYRKSGIINSVDIHNEYTEGGGELSRRQLTEKLVGHFKGDLIALSTPGMATILSFRSTTAKLLHLVPDEEADDTEESIKKVAKKIVDNVKEMPAVASLP